MAFRTNIMSNDNIVLDEVRCNPTRDMTLLECDAQYTSIWCYYQLAFIRCRDEQRVKNVTAAVVNPSTSMNTVHTVLITWET